MSRARHTAGERPPRPPARALDTGGRRESGRRFGAAINSVVAKKPVVKFVGLAIVLVLAFWALTTIPYVRTTLHPGLLGVIADSSAWLLRRLGEDASAIGDGVHTPRFSLTIRRGCDAIDPIGLFAAATLAFPVRWRWRLLGAAIGSCVLFAANYVRIVSLYYVGVHAPASFEMAHIDIWQPVFVLLSVTLWIVWAWWATGAPRRTSDVHVKARGGVADVAART